MSFNLPFGVFVADDAPADLKYTAADTAARELYVTNSISYEGMQVYQIDTQELWILNGTTNADWVLLASGGNSSQLYDGVDTEANILALTGAQYNDQVWFASDTKNIWKYFSFDGGTTYEWQQLNLNLNAARQTWELPTTPDGQTQNVGEEIFFVTENAGLAVTSLNPVVFLGQGVSATDPTIKTAIRPIASQITEASTYGINTVDIAAGGIGKVTLYGLVQEVNTSAWAVNDVLYVDPIIPGGLTNNKPSINAWVVGRVLVSDPTNGIIYTMALRNADLSSSVNTVGGIGVFFTADVETVNAVDFYEAVIGNAGATPQAIETITALALTPIGQNHITSVFSAGETLLQGAQRGQLEFVQNGGGDTEVQFTVEIYQADGITAAVEDSGTGLPAGDLGQPPIYVLASSSENAVNGVKGFAQLTGFLPADFVLPAGKRLLYHILAEKTNGGGGTRDYDIYFGNTAASYIEITKKLELSDLGDVNISVPSNGQALLYSNGLWTNQPIPSSIGGSYNDISALIAAQGSQVAKTLYTVLDASADFRVGSGYAYYQKLTSTTGSLITDYRLVSTEEGLAPAGPPVLGTYADLLTAVADQGNQKTNYIYYLTDASGLDDIASGRAYVEYLGTTNGDKTDYRLVGDYLIYENGLTETDGKVELGGTLVKNTVIQVGGNFFEVVSPQPAPNSARFKLNAGADAEITQVINDQIATVTNRIGLLGGAQYLASVLSGNEIGRFKITSTTIEMESQTLTGQDIKALHGC